MIEKAKMNGLSLFFFLSFRKREAPSSWSDLLPALDSRWSGYDSGKWWLLKHYLGRLPSPASGASQLLSCSIPELHVPVRSGGSPVRNSGFDLKIGEERVVSALPPRVHLPHASDALAIVFAWRGVFCFSSRRCKGFVSSSGLGCFRSWETASLLLVGSCTGFVWSCGYRSLVVLRLHPRRCGKGLSSMAFSSASHEGALPLLSSPMYLVELLWLCFVSSLTGPKRSKTETGVLFRIRSSSCSAGWVVHFLLAGSEVFYSGLSPSQPVFVFVLNKARRSSGCVRSLVCRSIHVGLGLGGH
ncbi:hypothetical protein IGI04_022365 [Brassica rapa subsp. trilocularis]|uniref:Uncharacterized protein n=1 Tax=Brassica rapa subsp. trilocularis TaxID=1813537 RepID=A0ABQ7M0Q9_BRACM|nr:hypothetical protein IGI04_022365 [Brassica rapa subsp. trilocularis]